MIMCGHASLKKKTSHTSAADVASSPQGEARNEDFD